MLYKQATMDRANKGRIFLPFGRAPPRVRTSRAGKVKCVFLNPQKEEVCSTE